MEFPTTHWSMLAQASLNGDRTAHQALADFYLRYRQPVIRFLRWRGVQENRIEDMTQDFFLQIMTHSSLQRAEKEKGRFRSYLTGAVTRFLADDVDRNNAQKRGGGVPTLSMDVSGDEVWQQAHSANTPEANTRWMDRAWAVMLMERALSLVHDLWIAAGKETRFIVLRCFLPGAAEILSQEEAANRLQMSVAALRAELSRLREDFRQALRRVAAETVDSPAQIDEELAYLRDVLTSESPPT